MLAEDVTAAVALPSFDNSGMDGYAVHAKTSRALQNGRPRLSGSPARSRPATPAPTGWSPGTAIKIMTGARLPDGADAVVPVEWTDGGTDRVAVYRPVEPGNAVRYAGGDAAEGETLLSAGDADAADADRGGRVGGAQGGHGPAHGRGSSCCPPGNELTEPGTPLVPGQIWDSNSYMIAAARPRGGRGRLPALRSCPTTRQACCPPSKSS